MFESRCLCGEYVCFSNGRTWRRCFFFPFAFWQWNPNPFIDWQTYRPVLLARMPDPPAVSSTGANLSTCLMHFHFWVNKLTWHLELNKKKTKLASNDSIPHNIKCEGVQREGFLKSEHFVSIYSFSLWDNKRRCFVQSSLCSLPYKIRCCHVLKKAP